MVSSSLSWMAGVPVLVCAPEGPPLDGEAAALDLVTEAITHDAEVVAVPVERCPDEFFRLASGVAGAVLQKFVNYRLRLVVIGDIAGHLARSGSLRAFVSETNRGGAAWFLATHDDLAARLQRTGPAGQRAGE